MKQVRIKLKNYRAFSDSEPLYIEIGSGLTAITGKNNSGKSAIKLFFYEFRQFFEVLSRDFSSTPSLSDIFTNNHSINIGYNGISDNEEIFYNGNERLLSLEIEILGIETVHTDGSLDKLFKIEAVCNRIQPQSWKLSAFGAKRPLFNIASTMPGRPGISQNSEIQLPDIKLDCRDFLDAMATFRDARYYGPFRNVINQGSGQNFDLHIGNSFVNLWMQWKTSGIKAHSRAIDKITEDVRSLFGFNRLEINASPSLNTLMVSVDGQPYRLAELGSGLTQFIMVLANAATNPPSILLIDEPETNLHPSLQIDFLLSVAQYARNGVIFSTHSIGLARSVADRIYSVQKSETGSLVRPFESTPNYLEFIGELSFSTFKEMGADRILLVEGVSDVKTVQQLLRLVKKEHTTVILPLGGDQLARGGREAELEAVTRLSNHIFALVDSERTAEGEPAAQRRIDFAATCNKLNIQICVTDKRAIENYFSERAIRTAFDETYRALGPFELLKENPKPWRKTDSWKIARQMQLEELSGTDVGEFLRDI